MSETEGTLVQPEGVNAGSAEETSDRRDTPPSAEAARSGGRPEDADDTGPAEDENLAGQSGGSDMAGAATTESGYPSSAEGPSGQDAGSMD